MQTVLLVTCIIILTACSEVATCPPGDTGERGQPGQPGAQGPRGLPGQDALRSTTYRVRSYGETAPGTPVVSSCEPGQRALSCSCQWGKEPHSRVVHPYRCELVEDEDGEPYGCEGEAYADSVASSIGVTANCEAIDDE